jgi:hypothetical protein
LGKNIAPNWQQTTSTQQAQLVQDRELHFLTFVGDEHRAAQRCIDMSLPARPQHLGAAVAVGRMQLDAEQLAHLSVKVRHSRLRPR